MDKEDFMSIIYVFIILVAAVCIVVHLAFVY